MRGRVLLLTIFLATAVMAQAPPAAVGTMTTPSPVSGTGYATEVRSEMRSNYLRGGFTYSSSYIDNLYANSGSASLSEFTVSIMPSIAFDATTPRQHVDVSYSPGFTFYNPSNELNEVDNSATVNYSFRLTQHSTLSASDRLVDSSSTFSQSGEGVSGAPVTSTPGVTPPFAKMLTNSVNAQFTMQTGLNDMFGVSGTSSILHYPNAAQTPGLYNSSVVGGGVFYAHRISALHSLGIAYRYIDAMETPTASQSMETPTAGQSTVQGSTFMGYYTISPLKELSMSVSGGAQYYTVSQAGSPDTSSLGPTITASMGWQGNRSSFAASYSQAVTGGGGLLGAYHTQRAEMTARWRVSRTWTTGLAGTYAINKAVTGMLSTGEQNGHSLGGSATLEHPIRGAVKLSFNFDHIHQSYSQVAAISPNPDTNRVSAMISWNFLRQLGR